MFMDLLAIGTNLLCHDKANVRTSSLTSLFVYHWIISDMLSYTSKELRAVPRRVHENANIYLGGLTRQQTTREPCGMIMGLSAF